MKFTIISGSHRQNSQSEKVGKYLQAQLEAQGEVSGTDLISLGEETIHYWDEAYWNKESDLHKEVQEKWMGRLKDADGFIVIAPEWGGMVPGALKNFMLYWGEQETGHKPAMIATISAGINGAYPVSELRMSSYKNSKIVYIPEHLIVRSAKDMMNDHDPNGGEKFDRDLRERAQYSLNMLISYAKALKTVRDTDGIFNAKYPFGM